MLLTPNWAWKFRRPVEVDDGEKPAMDGVTGKAVSGRRRAARGGQQAEAIASRERRAQAIYLRHGFGFLG